MSRTVFIVAGGTGGHVFPALALADELRRRNVQVECITDKRGEKYYLQVGLTPHVVDSSAWASTWAGRLKAGYKILSGMVHSFELCREHRPACVIGFGGYPSFPTVKAAQMLRIPTVLHEQNAVFGRANRQLSVNASAIATSFQETKMMPGGTTHKKVYTGNPVRDSFLATPRDFHAPQANEMINLLVFGGSQGSSLFGSVLPDAVALLDADMRARLHVIQQARHEDVDALTARYAKMNVNARVQPFFTNILSLYKKAHLVIGRAGASTIAELTALGLPSVIVPLAISLDGDQAQNARHLVAHNAAIMIEEKGFTAAALAAKLTTLFSHPAQLDDMAQAAKQLGKPAAASHVADVVMRYL